MFDKLIKTVTDFLPNLLWLFVAVVTGVTIYQLLHGEFPNVDGYVQGIVMAVLAGFTTSLWAGAIENGSD
jgi:hypothetical protein